MLTSSKGGHDNGYLPTLASLDNEQLLDKVVILKGYDEIATELRTLKLGILNIDGLFRTQKVSSGSRSKRFVESPQIQLDTIFSTNDDDRDTLRSPFSRMKGTITSAPNYPQQVDAATSLSPTKEKPLDYSLVRRRQYS